MLATTPIRVFLVFALLALLGFGIATMTAGAPVGVLLGTVASFAAAIAFVVELERDPVADPQQTSAVGARSGTSSAPMGASLQLRR